MVTKFYISPYFVYIIHLQPVLPMLPFPQAYESYYENPETLEIVTLENTIYMAMKNDNAFVFEKKLHLYEIKEEEPMLELKVRFLNINEGCNEVLKRNCKVLKEYMIFVEQIRKNIHYLKMSASEAVEKAVTECIQEDVLRDFLIANRKEVVSMSIFEYDEEKEIKLIREAEYQAGVEDGIETGRKDGIITSLKIMKRTLKDFESVYHEIKGEELFSNLSKEDIKALFDQA